MNTFDVGIIGAGVAGSFAAYKIAKDHKDVKAVLFDLGRPPMKRRRQLEGWLGCLPNSDGKLYLNDTTKVSEITGLRKAKSAFHYLEKTLSNVNSFKVIKDRSPSSSMEKKLAKHGYTLTLNDYIQMYPRDIHSLSKYMAESIEKYNNITYCFDNEVKKISKRKNMFVIEADEKTVYCKKLIIAVGRSGWRWARDLYNNFGIVDSNDTAHFGIRIEMTSTAMKDFNKSNCSFSKDNIDVGPLSWFGTVIPEDHLDLAISAFRSNENRWKSDKVSFNLIGNIHFPNRGFEETDRVGKLAFVLSNDRILKERVAHILSGKSKILSYIKEYNWINGAITQLSEVIPEVATKAYFHIPTIIPSTPSIIVGPNLETEIEGMFVAGESAGVHGILAAGTMGIIAADNVCK